MEYDLDRAAEEVQRARKRAADPDDPNPDVERFKAETEQLLFGRIVSELGAIRSALYDILSAIEGLAEKR